MELIPWLRAQWDRVAAWVAILAGALALLLGWLGVSRSAFPSQQIPYVVSGGLVGLFLVGIGGTLWLSADLRDEWRKLDELETRVAQWVPDPPADLSTKPAANGATLKRRTKAAAQ